MRRWNGLSWLVLVSLIVLLPACGSDAPGDNPTPANTAEVVHQHPDRSPVDGEEALRWLLEGNERFSAGKPKHDYQSQRRRMMLTSGQDPFAIILGCSDSRVPPELVFDFGLGEAFVIRVAGNVLAADEAGSIEYGVEHLGVPLVLVLGHEGCGAVTAAFERLDDEVPELAALLQLVRPSVEGIDESLPHDHKIHAGVEANVRRTVKGLVAIMKRDKRLLEHKTLILGGVYELKTGLVRILEDTRNLVP